MWAARTGIVNGDDAALLLEVERAREVAGPAQLLVVGARGISERTLRRRRDRTLASLRAARGGYLTACA